MSRIILTRHPNGEEHIVAGWDRPLNSAFVDEYDDEGEPVRTRGPLVGQHIEPSHAETIARGWGAPADNLAAMVAEHRSLEYPESNRVEDWTT